MTVIKGTHTHGEKTVERSISQRAVYTKKSLRNFFKSERGFKKTAATYSPTVTQYHRRGKA